MSTLDLKKLAPPTRRDPQEAFRQAISTKQLSIDKNNSLYAGNWMYMHSSNDLEIDYFKNTSTREYIDISNKKKSK